MVAFLHLDQRTAHGISLVALVFTGLVGAASYALHRTVDVHAAILMTATAVLTARIGARFAHALPDWKLKRSFGAYLLIVSALMLIKPYLTALHTPAAGMVKSLVLLLTGMVSGFLSGMMGVGGGAVMIPAMVLLAGFDQHLAQGTSLLVMVPAGGTGAYTHWKLGNVRTAVLRGLVPGVMIGSASGGSFAHLLSDGSLRTIFAILLLWTGIRYLRIKKPAQI
jgi:uncharacterized membrane protein YfcA